VFNNPTITKEMVQQKLLKLDQELQFEDHATGSRISGNPEILDRILFDKIVKPGKDEDQRPHLTTLGFTPSQQLKLEVPVLSLATSRLEVPAFDQRRHKSADNSGEEALRRSSFGSSSSSSLSRNSQEIEIVIEEAAPAVNKSQPQPQSQPFKDQPAIFFNATPVIVEQPEPDAADFVGYEPRRSLSLKKHSLKARSSLEPDRAMSAE